MQSANLMIDFMQSSKKQFVAATVSDEKIKAGLNSFIDKQTELCKIMTKNNEEFTKIIVDNIIKPTNICKP